jgi:hypothetical protein
MVLRLLRDPVPCSLFRSTASSRPVHVPTIPNEFERQNRVFRTQRNHLCEMFQRKLIQRFALVTIPRHRHMVIIPDYANNSTNQLIARIRTHHLTSRQIF